MELAVSCLLRTAFSVSDVVLLPIPSVCALFCSLNRQRWGFKNLALISRNPGIPLYISGIVFSQTLWFHANLKCLIPGITISLHIIPLIHLIHTFTILYHSQDHLLKTGHLVCWCSFIELFKTMMFRFAATALLTFSHRLRCCWLRQDSLPGYLENFLGETGCTMEYDLLKDGKQVMFGTKNSSFWR